MASTSNQPNNTLYINNLNGKVNKQELRTQLFALFTTYGKVIDVVASKGDKMRGQAFLVFTDLASATSAMRACDGMIFYEKPLHITYAKTKSWATLRREDPSFVPPTSANARQIPLSSNDIEKRARDDEAVDIERSKKREKAANDDEDDAEEMEIEEDEDQPSRTNAAQAPSTGASARLLCTNLPQEVTDGVLSVLFSQYRGFQTTHVTQSPMPSATGAKVKMAQVIFESPELASVAKDALDGFSLKKGWTMGVAFA